MHDAFGRVGVFPAAALETAVALDARVRLADEDVFLQCGDELIVLPLVAAVVLLGLPSQTGAQTPSAVEPFNLATVDIAGREAVALVLREQFVVELDGANRNLQMTGNYPVVAVPDNMVDLIGQYEYGLKHRIYEIVNHVVGKGQITGTRRPAYVHNASDVRFLAPLRYPGGQLIGRPPRTCKWM